MNARSTIVTAAMLFGAAGCGGGGGGSTPATLANPNATSAPNAPATNPPPITPTSYAVSGSVVSIPQGVWGATASPQTPLANAAVVIGPGLIAGATPPAVLPAGDVLATTSAAGAFSANVSVAPAPPPSPVPGTPGGVPGVLPAKPATFVLPANNIFGVTTPASGYFVMVFPSGGDGKSVGAQLPVHAFVGVGSGGALGTFRSTTASSDEAGWLAQANLDRGAKGQVPEIFDEYAEEAAREHAADMLTELALCDYNMQNQGPLTRYGLLHGLGEDLSNIGIYGGPQTTTTAFWEGIEAAYVAEGNNPPPSNYHYEALMYPYAVWMGVAVASGPWAAGGSPGANEYWYSADQENVNLVNPYPSVYDVAPHACPAGIVANQS